MPPVFATAYLPSIAYFQCLTNEKEIFIEQWEHFQKQTVRNRCFILSPNGVQCLSIPVTHISGKKQLVKDLKISYVTSWQRLHWRSITAAYNRSPFFEYYAEEFKRFYCDDTLKWLIDFNEQQLNWILKSLKKPITIGRTTGFSLLQQNDCRLLSNAKSHVPLNAPEQRSYNQVFGYKFGFTANLSIIDLLFNTGNRSIDYLEKSFN